MEIKQQFKQQFKPSLDLSGEENALLSDLMVQWRQIHIQKHRDAYYDGLRKYTEPGKAYEELLGRLPANDRETIDDYVSAIRQETSYDVDFFYQAGIEDGIRLARYVLGVEPHQEQ